MWFPVSKTSWMSYARDLSLCRGCERRAVACIVLSSDSQHSSFTSATRYLNHIRREMREVVDSLMANFHGQA